MRVLGTDFVVYQVADIEKSIAFYRDTLGMTLEGQPMPTWAEFTATPTTLCLYQPDDAAPPGPRRGGAIGLAVDDVQAAVAELKGKDVTVHIEPLDTPVCWFAVIADPDGNAIALHQRKDGTFG